jgi:hypothetical protein
VQVQWVWVQSWLLVLFQAEMLLAGCWASVWYSKNIIIFYLKKEIRRYEIC